MKPMPNAMMADAAGARDGSVLFNVIQYCWMA